MLGLIFLKGELIVLRVEEKVRCEILIPNSSQQSLAIFTRSCFASQRIEMHISDHLVMF